MKQSKYQPLGRWIRVDKRLAIYLRDRWTCGLCGKNLEGLPRRQITLDHIIPKSRQGGNDPTNIYTCCIECNASRQDKPLPADKEQHIKKITSRPLEPYLWKARKMLEDEKSRESES